MEEKIYKEMYLHLFNAVTDALELMGGDDEAAQEKLMAAQQECEQIYINAGD